MTQALHNDAQAGAGMSLDDIESVLRSFAAHMQRRTGATLFEPVFERIPQGIRWLGSETDSCGIPLFQAVFRTRFPWSQAEYYVRANMPNPTTPTSLARALSECEARHIAELAKEKRKHGARG
jgi:hypothetical protein